MALIGTQTTPRNLLIYGAKNSPSLIIDCIRVADPHSVYPEVTLNELSKTYVIEVDLIYKLRDTLIKAKKYLETINSKLLIIIYSSHLFSYHDKLENSNILEHSLLIMKMLGKSSKVVVTLTPCIFSIASKYCDEVINNWPYC